MQQASTRFILRRLRPALPRKLKQPSSSSWQPAILSTSLMTKETILCIWLS
jgi:hypothetical protein